MEELTSAAIHADAYHRIAEPMREALADFCARLSEWAGERLASVTAYGAVVDGGFDPAQMTATTVAVLTKIDLNLLRGLGEEGARHGRRSIAAPLVMTPEQIASSTDSFPLELLEIHQQHATLVGTDHFASLDIKPEHARLQCEREFKRILMRLRQGLLAAAGRDAALGELAIDVGQHLLRTLRGILWLKGHTQFVPRTTVVAECEKLVGRPLAGLRAAMRRDGEHDWQGFVALYEDVDALASMANDA